MSDNGKELEVIEQRARYAILGPKKPEETISPRDKIIGAFRRLETPTWSDLAKAIDDAKFDTGFGYLSFHETPYSFETDQTIYKNRPIQGTVVAYYVQGGSEGEWVHVHEMKADEKRNFTMSKIIILVKMLGLNETKEAQDCVNFISECCRYINMW